MRKDDIIFAVKDYMDNDDWHYDFNEEKSSLSAGMNIRCKLKSIRYYMYAAEDSTLIVLAVSPISADMGDETVCSNVMEYLTRANYGLRHGNFEFDLRDGEIRYKMSLPLNEFDELPPQAMERMISIPALMFERYGNGLAALLMGFSDVKTEIEKAENPSES